MRWCNSHEGARVVTDLMPPKFVIWSTLVDPVSVHLRVFVINCGLERKHLVRTVIEEVSSSEVFNECFNGRPLVRRHISTVRQDSRAWVGIILPRQITVLVKGTAESNSIAGNKAC